MDELAHRLAVLTERIHAAERAAGRVPGVVEILAVSKTHGAEVLARAYRLGLRHFGENYLQEAQDKQAHLALPALVWHFIGPIQSNKTRALAEDFQWVEGIDRLKIAERLNAQRPAEMPPLDVCVQVNISGEASKSGVAPAALPALLDAVAALPRLRLRGLMVIPAPAIDPAAQRPAFARTRALFDHHADAFGLDTLSMGMSDDLDAAILEGATRVRVGTALFGSRPTLVGAVG